MNHTLSIHLPHADHPAAIPVQLDAAGAIFWPEGQTLFIADPHFGKEATFHSAGIAIPAKLLEHDLARLDQLITRYQAQRLIVLGDFFHTKESQSDAVLAQLAAWRSARPTLEIGLVPGNHDLHAGAPPEQLAIAPLAPESTYGPFCLAHHPLDAADSRVPSSSYRLAGHLHPTVTLHGPGGTTMSERSFIVGPSQTILPAFGSFTGGLRVMPTSQDRVFVIGEGQIIEITRRSTARPSRQRQARRP